MKLAIKAYPYQAVLSGISVLACTFLISLSFLYKKKLLAQYETKLVIILLLFYDGLCLTSLFPVYNRDSCTGQGFFIQFFSLSGILWTGFINLVNYRGVIKKISSSIPIKYPIVVTLIISAITCSVPFSTTAYSESTSWCWFDLDGKSAGDEISILFYMYGFFYVIAWIIIGFIVYVFVRIWNVYKDSNADISRYKQIIFIPIILFACFLPLTISRILQSGKIGSDGFQIFSACVMRSLGFWNSLVYGYHSNIKTTLYEAYHIDTVSTATDLKFSKIEMT